MDQIQYSQKIKKKKYFYSNFSKILLKIGFISVKFY